MQDMRTEANKGVSERRKSSDWASLTPVHMLEHFKVGPHSNSANGETPITYPNGGHFSMRGDGEKGILALPPLDRHALRLWVQILGGWARVLDVVMAGISVGRFNMMST